jgi:hypothetical protein
MICPSCDALAHRAEMHRDVRGVGHQAALGVEDCAGKIKPLLDVESLETAVFRFPLNDYFRQNRSLRGRH